MSWTAETCIFYGYKIPTNIFREVFKYCDKNWKTDSSVPEDWEDYFIDMNPMSNTNDTYFGVYMRRLDESDNTIELDSLHARLSDTVKLHNVFDNLFKERFEKLGYAIPECKRYVGVRYV